MFKILSSNETAVIIPKIVVFKAYIFNQAVNYTLSTVSI